MKHKSARSLAKAAGVPYETLRDWIVKGRLVVPQEGYTAEEITEWIQENVREEINPDYQIAKAKREHHNAELARLKVERVKGNLLEAHEVEATWSQAMARIAEHYDKEITKAAPKLSKQAPAEILKELRALFRRVREKSMVTQ